MHGTHGTKHRLSLFTLLLLLAAGCGGNGGGPASPTAPRPPTGGGDGGYEVLFESGFEEPGLGANGGGGWSTVVLQSAAGAPRARFEVRTDRFVSPTHSGWFFAPPGGGGENCGKASLIHRQIFEIGETMEVSASYWLEEPAAEVAPQLLDVECDPADCGLSSSPGVRIVTTRDGRLRIDWKFLNWFANNGLPPPADAPPPSPPGPSVLPTRSWFRLTLRMVLGKGGAGLTEVYLDDRLEISITGTNIAPEGMEPLSRYSGIEIGVTCNPTSSPRPASLYVDDVVLRRRR